MAAAVKGITAKDGGTVEEQGGVPFRFVLNGLTGRLENQLSPSVADVPPHVLIQLGRRRNGLKDRPVVVVIGPRAPRSPTFSHPHR